MTLIDTLVAYLWSSWRAWRRSEEFGRTNVISFVWIKNFLSNTWSKREEKRKLTFRMGENETNFFFMLIEKEHSRYM